MAKGSIRFNDAVNAEVTTDGTDITKVVNVATGEEYGGGGSGGLSWVNITFDIIDYITNTPINIEKIVDLYSNLYEPLNPEWSLYGIYSSLQLNNNILQVPYDASKTCEINVANIAAIDANEIEYYFDIDNSPFSVEGNATAKDDNGVALFTGDFTIHMGLHVSA